MPSEIHVLVGQTVTVTPEYHYCSDGGGSIMTTSPTIDKLEFSWGAVPPSPIPVGWTTDNSDPTKFVVHCNTNPGSGKVVMWTTQGGTRYEDSMTIIAGINSPDPALGSIKVHAEVS